MVATAAALRLVRADRRAIASPASGVIGCIVVRNERARLPTLLAHHRRLGIDQFFVVDNGSTDDTVAYLLAQDDVRVWSSDLDFREANYGASWFEALLSEHALGHWVAIIDADELLWYPDCETRALADLCAELDESGHRAMGAVLLDLYPEGPLADAHLTADVDPLALSPFFDRRWCHTTGTGAGPFQNQVGVWGGVRRRVFGGGPWDYCLNKVPLLRFDRDCNLVGGQHATNLDLAPVRGAVLHFKFVAAFAELVATEVERGQREAHASEYHSYREALCLDPRLTLHDPAQSVRFEGSAQLVDLGIIGAVPDLDRFAHQATASLGTAARRFARGDNTKALVQYQRSADLLPTAVTPLLRRAQLLHEVGDEVGARDALEEARQRQPDDLPLLDLLTPMVRPAWVNALGPSANQRASDVEFDAFVDGTFGWPDELTFERRVYSEPWAGCIHAVSDAPAHLGPFARRGLSALLTVPELRRSLFACVGLTTFSEAVAERLAEHTSVPIEVRRPTLPPPSAAFDLDRFLDEPRKQLVQLGWWMARVNSICDVPLHEDNPLGMKKVRCVEAARARLIRGLARADRLHAGWPRDAAPLRNTTEVLIDEPTSSWLARGDSIVFADLYDSNADAVVLECMNTATPILVNPRPAVIEYLGPDYPLYFDSLEDAATKATDVRLIERAHQHLVGLR